MAYMQRGANNVQTFMLGRQKMLFPLGGTHIDITGDRW